MIVKNNKGETVQKIKKIPGHLLTSSGHLLSCSSYGAAVGSGA